MKLTQELVREHFTYDPDLGVLTKCSDCNSVPICLPYIYFKGGTYTTARIIYQYMVYDAPPKLVMRIDRDPANNKWSNFTTTMDVGIKKIRTLRSGQKRPVELGADDMQRIFRYDIDTKELWFLLPPVPVLVTKTILKFKWQEISYMRNRAHVIRRMKYIAQNNNYIDDRTMVSRAKRRETQRTKALRRVETT